MTSMHRPENGPERLKKRADFLRTATGQKAHFALFTVQGRRRADASESGARVGFTVTKKVGNAVERNRIKRRLRALVRVVPDLGIAAGHDYVVVARRDALHAPWSLMSSQFRAATRKLGRPKAPGGSRSAEAADRGR